MHVGPQARKHSRRRHRPVPSPGFGLEGHAPDSDGLLQRLAVALKPVPQLPGLMEELRHWDNGQIGLRQLSKITATEGSASWSPTVVIIIVIIVPLRPILLSWPGSHVHQFDVASGLGAGPGHVEDRGPADNRQSQIRCREARQ